MSSQNNVDSGISLRDRLRKDPETEENLLKLILIRHSESEENRRIESCKVCCRGGKGEMSCIEVSEIFRHEMRDAPVSDRGHRMIACVRNQLESHASDNKGNLPWVSVDLYLHSPLVRTRDTLAGLFPDAQESFRELSCLREKQPMEFVFPCTFHSRLAEFRRHLAEEVAHAKVVVVGGHSQFFKAFLKMDRKMENVEVRSWTEESHTSRSCSRHACMHAEGWVFSKLSLPSSSSVLPRQVVECFFDRHTREVVGNKTLFVHNVD